MEGWQAQEGWFDDDGYLFMPAAESLYDCYDPGDHLCETGSFDADGAWSTVHTWPAHDWLARISDARAQYTLASPVRPASGLARYGALQRVYGLAECDIHARLVRRELALGMIREGRVDELADMLDPDVHGYAEKLGYAEEEVLAMQYAPRIWMGHPRLERFTREVARLEKEAAEEERALTRATLYEHLLDDEMVVYALVSFCGDFLGKVSERLQDSEHIVLAAVSQYGRAMHFASERLRRDYDFVRRAVQESGMALVDADTNFALCRDLALLAVRQDGMVLEHLWSWGQDDDVALAAVQQNGWALQFANPSPEVILAAVQQNGMALRILLDRNDKRANEFALAAVSSCGVVLQYLDAEMRRSEQIVRAAIKQSRGRALEWASRALKGDKAVVLEAVTLHDRSLQFATPELRADGAFMAAAAARNPRVAYDAEQAEATLANVQKRRQQWRASRAPVTKKVKRWNDTGEKLKRQRDKTFGPGSVDGKLQKRGESVCVRLREFRPFPGHRMGRLYGQMDVQSGASMAEKIPDLQLLGAAAKLWLDLPEHTRRTKPELAAIQLRSPMFVRLSAAQIAKLKPTELSSDGWARDDAFELLDLYADDIVQKLCTRDEKPNEGLSINIGLGALQTRWCFRCGEFMRQHRVDRHTKSKAHERNVLDRRTIKLFT